MNKKKLILPITVLSLCVLVSVIILLFTTSFAYCFNVNRNKSPMKVISFIDKAYEIEPNSSNECVKEEVYSIYTVRHDVTMYFYQNNDFSQEALDKVLSQYPEGYMQKVVELSKYQYKNPEETEKSIEFRNEYSSSHFMMAIPIISEEYKDTYYGVRYAIALYLNGEKEESQRVIEKVMEENKKACPILTDYVLIVHDVEKDKDFQKWMLETEKKAVENVKETKPDFPYNDYYKEALEESYRPF